VEQTQALARGQRPRAEEDKKQKQVEAKAKCGAQIDEMIHEKQVRQLCAIHSVNNLLQLSSDLVFDCADGGRCDQQQRQ